MAERARVWYQPLAQYDDAAVARHLQPAAMPALQQVHDHLAGLREWTPAAIHDALDSCAKALGLGLGKVAQPLRVAITGPQVRSEGRRVGKEGVSRCGSRWSAYHLKKK